MEKHTYPIRGVGGGGVLPKIEKKNCEFWYNFHPLSEKNSFFINWFAVALAWQFRVLILFLNSLGLFTVDIFGPFS